MVSKRFRFVGRTQLLLAIGVQLSALSYHLPALSAKQADEKDLWLSCRDAINRVSQLDCQMNYGQLTRLDISPERGQLSTAVAPPKNLTPLPYEGKGEIDSIGQAKQLYEAGKLAEAATVLQQAASAFAAQGDTLKRAVALSNLSLVYQEMGQSGEAAVAVQAGINLLRGSGTCSGGESCNFRQLALAQALDIQGKLQLAQGQSEQALETWKQAAEIYRLSGDTAGTIKSQINQAQAEQTLGLYRQALKTLTGVGETLQQQPDSLIKATGLRSLGNALGVAGNLKDSREILQQSLEVAQRLQSPQAAGEALLSLGNTAAAAQNPKAALEYYQQTIAVSPSPATRIQAQLNQLSLLVQTQQWSEAQTLWRQIQVEINALPPSRTSIYAQINLAESLMKIGYGAMPGEFAAPSSQEIALLLAKAVREAKNLQDKRAEAYALGYLGRLYELDQQWFEAEKLTEQALLIAQAINAPDIAYRWQWQLGRLQKALGRTEEAIAAYSQAVTTLQSLRSDLVAINQDVQFSFRESVEPVYRQLVALLLQPALQASRPSPSPVEKASRLSQKGVGQASRLSLSPPSQIPQKNLEKARDVIEALQLAELDNFFRDACLDAKPKQIDEVDAKAAVIYSIILENRLEVILSLPGQPLRNYGTNIPQGEKVENILLKLRNSLTPTASTQERLRLSQQVYDWLVRPAQTQLAENKIETLVFVLDGGLRNLPMAVLHDGQQYLVEKYAIALTPGLQLLAPQPLVRGRLSSLTGGLSEARGGFSELPAVLGEIKQITAEVSGKTLLNQDFTSPSLQSQINAASFPIVHLATHGQFSSNADETFILTWDDRIKVKQFENLLRSSDQNKPGTLELLVLSACQTAAGDSRAALGLAGVAVRSGARSTIATLWLVNDAATGSLMAQFYRELGQTGVSKAEALRRAQVTLLKGRYKNPYFWAPFVLVGNWL
jgi:CHAT domain-containing protein